MTTQTPDGGDVLARIRMTCLAFADVDERDSHCAPDWWIRDGHSFALFADHHRDDRLGVWCAADEDVRAEMIALDPARFYRPPYLGWRGWLGIDLTVDPDWPQIERFLREAHDRVAAR